MKSNLYTKIITICLLLLAILPVFSAFNLTWKEIVRLFIITLGLAYLYVRYLRRTMPQPQGAEGNVEPRTLDLEPNKPRTSHFALRTSHFEPLLLSIVYIFLITQFDPATSAIKDIIPQSRLNWFFIASSVLIFVAFGAFLLQRFVVRSDQSGRWISLSKLDKFVLVTGSVIIVALLIMKAFLHTVGSPESFLRLAKMSEYIMAYFIITRYFNFADNIRGLRLHSFKLRYTLRWIYLTLIAAFSIIATIGGYRIGYVIHNYKKADRYFKIAEYDKSSSRYLKADKLNVGLGLDYDSNRVEIYPKLSELFYKEEEINKAFVFLEKSIDILKSKIEDKAFTGEPLGADKSKLNELYIRLGGLLIDKGSYNEARVVFNTSSQITGDYLSVLDKLNEIYSNKKEIIKRVWGDVISIPIEDFEKVENLVIGHWAGNTEAIGGKHLISKTVSRSGNQSEYIELNYKKPGWDYWAMNPGMPLSSSFGIRLFVKAKSRCRVTLVINIDFRVTSSVPRSESRVIEEKWECLSIPDVYSIGKEHRAFINHNVTPMKINAIGIDTHGISCQLYVDDIEVYIPEQTSQ